MDYTILNFTDFEKAFDTVNTDILFYKMEKMNINPYVVNSLKWLFN